MTEPLVTVTIPTYNRVHLLRPTIESVLSQTMGDIEVFVSDNASTDGTRVMVEGLDDPRVHYVCNERNLGVHANLSRGMELGTAPYLCVLPDDDGMLPENVARKVKLLEDNADVDIAHGPSLLVHVDADGEQTDSNVYYTGGTSPHVIPGSEALRRIIIGTYWINFPAALIRRSIVGDVRFEAEDDLADDVSMFLRLLRNARRVGYVDEPLVVLRMHAEAHSSKRGYHGLSSDAFSPGATAVAAIEQGRERFFAKYGDEFPDQGELRAASKRWAREKLLWIVSSRTGGGESAETRTLLREAIKIEPRLVLYPDVAKLLVRNLAGSRGRDYVHRLRH